MKIANIGTRPALTMSVPVRCSANLVDFMMDENQSPHPTTTMMMSIDDAEMQDQIPAEGRLGIPGAAGGVQQQKYVLNVNGNGSDKNQTVLASQQQSRRFLLYNDLPSERLEQLLEEYSHLSSKYWATVLLPKESEKEVTCGQRDGSAYVLRCLKMWYDLPSEVLLAALSLSDRFLDTMSVKPKHVACMSVACFHIAMKQLGLDKIPAEDLVTISQVGCTARDLKRMAGVVSDRLGAHLDEAPITSITFLRIFHALFRRLADNVGEQLADFFEHKVKLEELIMRLEVLACDARSTTVAPPTLALCLISLYMDSQINQSDIKGSKYHAVLFKYIMHLQQFMNIQDGPFSTGFSCVSLILKNYNDYSKQPYKQRLVWRLSQRTIRVLRPTNRFRSNLSTIQESNPTNDDKDYRQRTESVSSEEEEDWPTSPIIPIVEQCEQ